MLLAPMHLRYDYVKNFGNKMDELMQEIDSNEKIFIVGDLNGTAEKDVEGMKGCVEDMVMERKLSPIK